VEGRIAVRKGGRNTKLGCALDQDQSIPMMIVHCAFMLAYRDWLLTEIARDSDADRNLATVMEPLRKLAQNLRWVASGHLSPVGSAFSVWFQLRISFGR